MDYISHYEYNIMMLHVYVRTICASLCHEVAYLMLYKTSIYMHTILRVYNIHSQQK